MQSLVTALTVAHVDSLHSAISHTTIPNSIEMMVNSLRLSLDAAKNASWLRVRVDGQDWVLAMDVMCCGEY